MKYYRNVRKEYAKAAIFKQTKETGMTISFSARLLKIGNADSFAVVHCRFVGADSGTCVVGSQGGIYSRVPVFNDGSHELLYQMWV